MGTHWEEVIREPSEIAVFRALANPDWNFRTIHGIAKEAGMSPGSVRKVIKGHPDLIGRSGVPNVKGRDLFYLIDQQNSFRRFLAKLRRFV